MTALQKLGFKTSPDGLVVTQGDGDRGDSPQKTSMAHIGMIAQDLETTTSKEEFKLAFNQNWVNRAGALVRDYTGIWNQADDFSRDQHDPTIIALGLYGYTQDARKYMRWFKYQNKDIGGPMTWALNIRAGIYWYLYPLLFLFDLQILIGAIVTSLQKDPESVDDDNAICRFIQAIIVLPTPVSWIARKIYVMFRPKNYGTSFKNEKSPILGALAWKHRKESGGNEAMVDLYRPIVERYFS